MNYKATFELYGDTDKPGFKTRIWQLIPGYRLSGWIADDGPCAVVTLEGRADDIAAFLRSLPRAMLPAFHLKDLKKRSVREGRADGASRFPFHVLASGARMIPEVRPDYAPCPDCVRELFDPGSRRRSYPFWGCSRCGAFYSALIRMPPVRRNTALSAFPPCSKCEAERTDRKDHHHFGSEHLSCPDCGPSVLHCRESGEWVPDPESFAAARKTLAEGRILALISLFGGFQLFVDVFSRSALLRLRHRNNMLEKSFMILFRDLETVRRYCLVSPEEERILTLPAAPCVVLKKRPGVFPEGDLVAPDSDTIIGSLPQTMQHHLLFRSVPPDTEPPPFEILAVIPSAGRTSAGRSNRDEVLEKLHGVADFFLSNDLRIGFDCPPSVLAVRGGETQIWRRSRGIAPLPLKLAVPLRRSVAAFGFDFNAAAALGVNGQIAPSQHLGQIRNRRDADAQTAMLDHLSLLFDVTPDVVACDMDTDLQTSAAAARYAKEHALPLIQIQTHHAHALACMAEHGLRHSLALVFGRESRGPDGDHWGAELLDAEIAAFRRLATFQPVELPGKGETFLTPSAQFIRRMAACGCGIPETLYDMLHLHGDEDLESHLRQSGGASFASHGALGLFDAAAAAFGLAPERPSYWGQAALRLLDAAEHCSLKPNQIPPSIRDRFRFSLKPPSDGPAVLDWSPLFHEFASPGWLTGTDPALLALAFHDAVASAAVEMAKFGAEQSGLRSVVLSGALFMDRLLADLISEKMKQAGLLALHHREIPPDESGICVGQAWHAGLSD